MYIRRAIAGLNGNDLSIQSTAVCQVNTSTPTPTTTPTSTATPLPNQRGLRISYYNNHSLLGVPVHVKDYSPFPTTPFLFAFGDLGPQELGYQPDNFSILFEGLIWIPEMGDYRFYLSNDDGAILRINGQVVTDDWSRQPPTGAIPIPFGNQNHTVHFTESNIYPISVEYREFTGAASIEIQWEHPVGSSPFSRVPLIFEQLYLPGGQITTTTPVPSPTSTSTPDPCRTPLSMMSQTVQNAWNTAIANVQTFSVGEVVEGYQLPSGSQAVQRFQQDQGAVFIITLACPSPPQGAAGLYYPGQNAILMREDSITPPTGNPPYDGVLVYAKPSSQTLEI